MLRLGEAWSSAQSSTAAELDYRGNFLVRFFGEGAGNGTRRIAAAASLVSRSSRSRAMFLRTSMACLPIFSIARAPSSAANRFRLARAMLSGDDSAGFLTLILTHFPTGKTRSILRSSGQHGRFSTSVKRHDETHASERLSALTLPRILSVLTS